MLLIFFRTFTVHDVISMLEEEEPFEAANIYIDPPPLDELTDENSAEEDEGGTVDNLNGRQLTTAQFIRSKPIRFGFKVWVLTTPLGYVLQFDPYQGARGRQTEVPGLGMGGSMVIDLISELQQDDSYHLTFDNLFTSLPLVDCLTKKGIGCTGTIRANRTEDCPLMPVNEMGKKKRGT